MHCSVRISYAVRLVKTVVLQTSQISYEFFNAATLPCETVVYVGVVCGSGQSNTAVTAAKQSQKVSLVG